MILQRATHAFAAVNSNVIIGVLTQPFGNLTESVDDYYNEKITGYIPSAHIKMLEASGAKIVPVSYKYHVNKVKGVLGQINALYIPGD